jgi:small subunit ribosomal protein S8
MTDPIADLLIRIKNAIRAGHDALNCPRSNLKVEILKVLQSEGFIESFDEVQDNSQGSINIVPRYLEDALSRKAVLRGIKRVSKPSRRVYVKKEDIPRVRNGLGIAILTTAKGVLTDKQARDIGVGGEVLCYVW